jgi:hypothetical protein
VWGPVRRLGSAAFQSTEIRKLEAIDEYSKWNQVWHEMNQNYQDERLISEVFAKIDSLRSIEFAYKSCPFNTAYTMDDWMQGPQQDNFPKTNTELITVLRALVVGQSTEIRHLKHDQLPTSFFLARSSRIPFAPDCHIPTLLEPLKNLETLQLSFSTAECPQAIFWNNLGGFLKTISKLKDLRLDFAPFQSAPTSADTGWIRAPHDPQSWYVPLSKVLGDHTWTSLEAVWFGGLLLCESGMIDFLGRHSTTLKSVKLFQIGLWQGSFKKVFACLAQLALTEFCLWGFFEALHCKDEVWRFAPHYRPFDETWLDTFKDHVEKRGREYADMYHYRGVGRSSDAQRTIEAFVLQEAHSARDICERPLAAGHSLPRTYREL